MERRIFMQTGLLLGAFGLTRSLARAASRFAIQGNPQQTAANLIEEQSGDPDTPAEVLQVDTTALNRLLPAFRARRGAHKDDKSVALATLTAAKTYVGVNRDNSADKVATMLKLFDLPMNMNGKPVPYCASGISYAACQAYCGIDPQVALDLGQPLGTLRRVQTDIDHYYFKTSPSCAVMVEDARTRGKWVKVNTEPPQPGWLVFYHWKLDGHPNHVGMVDHVEGSTLHTVEFNTSDREHGSQSNGGAVALKERQLQHVLGFIKTY
jgi:hypothetical protein